jgi:hypothetical protein
MVTRMRLNLTFIRTLLSLFYVSLLILIPVLLQGFVFLLAVFTTSINVASVIILLFVLFVTFIYLPNHHYKHRTAHRSIFCCLIVSQWESVSLLLRHLDIRGWDSVTIELVSAEVSGGPYGSSSWVSYDSMQLRSWITPVRAIISFMAT